MGIFQHLLLNCSGRSFTEGVIVVGGASLKEEQICQSLRVCFSTNSHVKHLCLPALNCIYVSVTITNSWFLSLYPHSMMAPSTAAVLRAPRKLCSFSYVYFFLRVRCC